jgi:hypothetical protein
MTTEQYAFPNGRCRRSGRSLVGVILLFAGACSADLRTAPRRTRVVSIESGDRQAGSAAAPLRDPVVVRVVGDDGMPVAGAVVRWTTPDGGSFSPSRATTDGHGVARTMWTLGTKVGAQQAHVTVDDADDTPLGAIAEIGGMPMPEPVALVLSTPDGSGQTVHPDHVSMPSSWTFGHQYLLITPYPFGNAGWENPSIFTGSTGADWAAPAGVSNPIVKPDRGYLSDPDAVAVPETNELWVYYRAVTAKNEIYLVRSRDGVRFDAPRLVASAENHDLVSPAVVRRGPMDWLMWSVKSGAGCGASQTSVELRRSMNGVDWSAPEKTTLDQGDGTFPWHIDVQWIPDRQEFWAVYNGKTAGTCTTAALYLATSTDGVRWTTYPSPILSRGASPELKDVVYRSTFAYDPSTDLIDFWYSGAKNTAGQYVWRSAYQRRTRGEVFATAARTQTVAARALLAPRPELPPLINPP